MPFFRNYQFRNSVKEKLVQIYATFEYSANHPYTILSRIARDSTVKFILNTCPRAVAVRTPKQLMDLCLTKVSIDGLYLEFGVFKGESLRYIAKNNPDQEVHGFDSFEGLPEAWVHNPQGTFTTQGKLPKVPHNVQLWRGYFENSLPSWCKNHDDAIAFLHIDCDLRSSTETVLTELANQIKPGTVILFDDYFNFPGWEEDGHAVLTEFLKKQSFSAEYIGYGFKELSIIVR
ncbi:MAG: class I SAM-dependent methyltransferase [Oscillatoriales cyanobacterium RM2_1_1]|nr:class I SAM-dependent methyltransferase [Oscillatoriales cyanobacterium SM2_3_0]NJO47841.1 class I SAM-dependent methyltransferase [Oscillatoriales cyanobacterium RM2_1_1]